jgi:predicted nuclease of predicted toxin-antitoxin system
MRFLLDVGISIDVTHFLQSIGHDAEHLHQLGLESLPDAEILARAVRDKQIVITHDLDFPNLLAASSSELPSVIVLRLRNMRPERVTQRLRSVLAGHSSDLEKGAVLSVSELQIRLRRLPLDPSGKSQVRK